MTTTAPRTPSRRGSATRRQPARPASRRRLPLLAALVVALLAVVAIALTGGGSEEATVAQTAPVTVDGSALPPFTGEGQDPALGLPVPDLRGSTFEGAPIDLAPGEHPTVLLFAAHWCSYCQNEVRSLSPWLRDGRAEDVKLMVVSTGVDAGGPNYPPSTWFANEDWPGAVMVDSAESAAAQAFGLTGYPYFVFIDGEGRVVGRHSGALGTEQLDSIVASLQG